MARESKRKLSWPGLALLTLPVLLTLSWTSSGATEPMSVQRAAGSPTPLAAAVAEHGRAAATAPEPATDIPAAIPAGKDTGGVAGNAGHKDLTVFFSIGVIVDILLVTAFLVWAAGQWSKTKKQEPKDHA